MPRGVYPIEKRKGLFPKGHPFFGNKKTQFQKGHKIWLGRKHTEETKRKISETNKKHTGWTHSEETKKKMSISAKMRWVNKKTFSIKFAGRSFIRRKSWPPNC